MGKRKICRLHSRGCICGRKPPPKALRVLAVDHLKRPVGWKCECGRGWYRISILFMELNSGRTAECRRQNRAYLEHGAGGAGLERER